MKTSLSILLGAFLSVSLVGAPQNSNDPNAQALDVLRKAIADYEKNPNAAATAARTNVPPKTAAPKKSLPPESTQAGQPAKPAAPKVQAPAAAASAPGAPMASNKSDLSFAEMEQMYLDGKISAKQFQKYLQDHTIPPVTAATARGTVAPPAVPTPSASSTTPPPAPAGQTVLTDVDKKLDDLLRMKAEREKAVTNNAATAGPKTKRQRLDEILKQLVDGKISDEEYKAKREKILAEPN